MFLAEVIKKYNEVAKWEKETGKTSPELARSPSTFRKLPLFVPYPNYSDVQYAPPGQNKVLDRLIDNYSIPKTSTSTSSSTSTVSSCTATEGPSTTTADAAEASTLKNYDNKLGNTLADIGFYKSTSVLRRRIEGHPNQAFTLFSLLGMAKNLTKIQFTLCNGIKAELQAVKE